MEMKTKILSIITIVIMSFAINAQIDRSKMPKPGPDPIVKLGKTVKFSLDNGIKVIMVENHKLPRVSVTLTIDNKPYYKGKIAGVSQIMGSLLGRGTKNITKDEFNEKVDFMGANINFFSSGGSARSLKKYFPEVLGLLADGAKNAIFSKEEFDKEVAIILESLKASEKDIPTIARRVENALVFGKNHPYGEFISKETIHNITLEDVKNNYDTYYRPNNGYLIIIGDINPTKTKKLVTDLFADWTKGNVPNIEFDKPKNVSATEINFVNMPNAKQSEVVVVNTVDLTLGDKDYYAALIANSILGGGGSGRLFNNLREDKGYTYGCYSSIRQSRNTGVFRAAASVRNMVTDSSIVEIQKEINKIRTLKISEKELKDTKEEYIGSFVMDIQKPTTAASYALNIELYNLPEDFYANYIKNINAVTIDDVQNTAIKYFKGDNARIIITGKGIDVLKNLEKTGYKIRYFDKKGIPTEKPEMTLPIPDGMTAANVIDTYIEAIGGKEKIMNIQTIMMVANANIQGTPIVLTSKKAAPNKTSQVISVMGNTMSKTVFNGEYGYQEARGQKMDMEATQIEEAKNSIGPIDDIAYRNGKLDRIEPVEDTNCYVVIYNEIEIFYNIQTGLKMKEIKTTKGPNGDIEFPTSFSEYKTVSGIKFPFKIAQKMGPMDLEFEVQEIKVNTEVTEEDFK